MAEFALRWTLDGDRMPILRAALQALAADPVEIARRRTAMQAFLLQHHPVWFSAPSLAAHMAELLRDEGRSVGTGCLSDDVNQDTTEDAVAALMQTPQGG